MSHPQTPAITIDLFATPDEAAPVITLMHRAFAQFTQTSGAMLETEQSLKAEQSDGLRVAVARLGERIVASAKHTPAPDGSLYFSRLAVDLGHRGHGLASLLVHALREQAYAEGLSGLSCAVRADETDNIAIYEHLGMEITNHETRMSRTGATLAVVVMADIEGVAR